jgi:Holliday junction resolvasome RuvABC endonuclease subunit
MTKTKPKYPRILAIVPSTRGIGFAVLDAQSTLADWGVRWVKGDKNAGSIMKIEKLIARYQPRVIVLEDSTAEDSRRAPRIRELSQQIIALAKQRNVAVELFTRQQVKKAFIDEGKGTKYEMAEVIANRFPEELSLQLPSKRHLWESVDSRMDVFDAVALALMIWLQRCKTK